MSMSTGASAPGQGGVSAFAERFGEFAERASGETDYFQEMTSLVGETRSWATDDRNALAERLRDMAEHLEHPYSTEDEGMDVSHCLRQAGVLRRAADMVSPS